MKTIGNESSRIMTDLSSDELIVNRFVDEKERVKRWSLKLGKDKSNIQPATFREGKFYDRAFDSNGRLLEGKEIKPLGIIPWTNPKNGDTWIAIVNDELDGNINFRYFYFWNTIGSIGLMKSSINVDRNDPNHYYRCIVTISSHAMLRYRDRLHLEHLTPFELITTMANDLTYSSMSIVQKEDREWYELCIKDGVFRGKILHPADEDKERPYVVVRFNTFISSKMLSHHDLKDFKAEREFVKEGLSVSVEPKHCERLV